MRKVIALTGLIAVALAGCERKAVNSQDQAIPSAPAGANAPAANAPAAQAKIGGPQYPRISDEACAVLGAYVKVEMNGDAGLPVQMRVPPAKDVITAPELSRSFKGLSPDQSRILAAGLTQSIHDGSELSCNWAGLGLQPPRPRTDESNAWIRFRVAVADEVAVLEPFTDGLTKLGSRCLYRKKAGTWTRDACVLTDLG